MATSQPIRGGLLLLTALLGCSGDDAVATSTPKSDAGDVSKDAGRDAPMTSDTAGDDFLREYAAAVCAMYEPCCDAQQLGYDADGCGTWFRKVTKAYFSGAFRPEAAAECLSDLASAREADPERCKHELNFDLATLRDSCRQAFGAVYSGGSALGGSCTLGGDCAYDPEGPVICYGGMCLLELRGEAGDGPCYLSGRAPDAEVPTRVVRCEASAGLYCHRSERVCKSLGNEGESCPYVNACKDGSTCVGGTCVALPGPDEACLNAVRGAGGTCGPGSACDKQTLVCGPALTEGENCREPAQCASRACMSGVCAKPEFTRALNCTGASK